METINFKTNIKCDACVAKVAPALNESVGKDNWKVNLQSPERILSVSGEADVETVQEALKTVGYNAEKI